MSRSAFFSPGIEPTFPIHHRHDFQRAFQDLCAGNHKASNPHKDGVHTYSQTGYFETKEIET